jgi:hypothetical protein
MGKHPSIIGAIRWADFFAWVRQTRAYPRRTALVVIICLILVLWVVRWDATVRLEAITDHAILVLGDSWDVPLEMPLKLDALYLDHIDRAASKRGNHLPVVMGAELDETDLHLQALKILGSAEEIELEMDATASELNIYVKRACVEGEFLRSTPDHNQGPVYQGSGPPDTLYFKTRPTESVVTRIELSTVRHWRLAKLPIQMLLVEKEVPKGSGQYLPKVKSGRVQILNAGRDLPLEWSDTLRLGDIKVCQRIFVEKDPEGLKIAFLGKVGHIEAGPLGFQSDLRPRLLESLYHNRPVAGLAVFALLWQITNQMLSRKKKPPHRT